MHGNGIKLVCLCIISNEMKNSSVETGLLGSLVVAVFIVLAVTYYYNLAHSSVNQWSHQSVNQQIVAWYNITLHNFFTRTPAEFNNTTWLLRTSTCVLAGPKTFSNSNFLTWPCCVVNWSSLSDGNVRAVAALSSRRHRQNTRMLPRISWIYRETDEDHDDHQGRIILRKKLFHQVLCWCCKNSMTSLDKSQHWIYG